MERISLKKARWGMLIVVVLLCSTLSVEAKEPLQTLQENGWVDGHVQSDDKLTVQDFVALMNTMEGDLRGQSFSAVHRPEGVLTREGAALLLQQHTGWPDAYAPFTDVPPDAEAAGAIGALAQKGVMQGLSSQIFGYGQPMTFGEAAQLVLRYTETIKSNELMEASVVELQQMMDEEQLTAAELVHFYLERIEKYDKQGPALNAMITVNDNALARAKQLDEERHTKGARGPLHGIPVVVKDNFDTADMPTTAGCLCLEDSLPPDDAHQVELLRKAGAIILGKTNLHEFAVGYTTSGSMTGQTLNPYALDRYPGGSSGGTGAAVAGNFAVAGLGSDTGGSIRIPSSMNSLVGIRPTVGLSSRDGIIPLALTQDVGGPMARTVADAAALLEVTAGYDPEDPVTSWSEEEVPRSYVTALDEDGLRGARIGLLTQLTGDAAAPEVNQVITEAVSDLEALGAEVIPVKLPHFDEIMSYSSLSGWEFKFQLNDYLTSLGDDAPYTSLGEIIEAESYDPAIEGLLKARNSRKSLDEKEYKDIVLYRTKLTQEDLLTTMADQELDALVYPTSSHPPAKIGQEQRVGTNVLLSSFSGFPAITVPAGFTDEGLPVGIELLGRKFAEPTLIRFAYSYEQGTMHRKKPEMLP
ncbi:amidase [Bacillaceae bacterium SIJ1]|uniref:amidase family protein n=1 Tax=Litoribacterium kuwaitense TaxID=1398745 RepID=UPI0013EC8F0D|nr:amidase family protein [Litoribacterium kuwaitense]NGP44588.1 amidase [Litoribacterium kuwaitense]